MEAAGRAAATVAASADPAGWLHAECRDWLARQASAGPVLVGCSGGADSVLLAIVLSAVGRSGGGAVELAHFHHGQRGAEADAEEALVVELAEALSLPLWRGRASPGLAGREAALREARYAFLHRTCRERGAVGLALGQHAHDVVEGQLLALARGSGTDGLASLRPLRRFPDGVMRMRPLLEWSAGAIRAQLDAWGVRYAEDSSNADTRHRRNALRARVVPELEAIFGEERLLRGALVSRQRLSDAQAVVDAVVDRLGIDLGKAEAFAAGPVRDWPREVGRRLVRRWWNRHHSGVPLSGAVVEAVLDALAASKALSGMEVHEHLQLSVSGTGTVWLEATDKRHPQPMEPLWWSWASGPLYLPDGSALGGKIIRCAGGEQPWKKADPWREAYLAVAEERLVVRGWRPGDRYRPLGAPGRRKLQDLFTDRGIPVEQRHRLPVIESRAGDILWIPGFPPADAHRLADCSKWALRLTYHNPSAGLPQNNGLST